MFDVLLKSKFYCKCKSDLKMIRSRLEMIKKKRNAMQRYLRNDVADLLKNGLDINAYGRAEGLLVELNKSDCYDFIEKSSLHILDQIAAMSKIKECPEDCREAVSSLMFAAARFADLPELRELRTLFSDRYENSVDYYVNKQLVEKLETGLPSKDMKLQLLQDIALESGLEWNAKALENKLYKETTCNEEMTETEKTRTENRLPRNTVPSKDEVRPTLPRGLHEVLPAKDIHMDTWKTEKQKNSAACISNDKPKEEDHVNEKPPKYKSIPPPYTKSSVVNKAKMSSSLEEEPEGPTQPSGGIPKSVRRKNLKSREKERMEERSKEIAAQQGQRVLKFLDSGSGGQDNRDEEEKTMDRLLKHYSRKKVPNEKGDAIQILKDKNRDGPNRSSSLPGEQTSPTQIQKGHTRATSLQPDMLNGNNVHVHPKLPDYDDFLARLAALRGN